MHETDRQLTYKLQTIQQEINRASVALQVLSFVLITAHLAHIQVRNIHLQYSSSLYQNLVQAWKLIMAD